MIWRVKKMSRWYLGDPCYVIPDAEWHDFCEKTYDENNTKDCRGHMDSIINWKGQTITIWSNGGDGSWQFDALRDINGNNTFFVDAGIFCVIDLDNLDEIRYDDIDRLGLIFDKEPDLYVEDGVVYVNDKHDDSVVECCSCGELVMECDLIECQCCWDEQCYQCFECRCEEE